MAKKIKISSLANTVMDYLNDYAEASAEDVKTAVRDAGKTVQKEIEISAPKDTGDYSKSWSVKNVKETANSLEVSVHSKGKYQMAHLLEFGHAKRNGGRVNGKVHIAPAEELGIKQLQEQLERCLKNG